MSYFNTEMTVNIIFYLFDKKLNLITIDDISEIEGVIDQLYAIESNLV